MAVTRDSLRRRSQAEQDFYAPMTGGTQIRYADAPAPMRDTYSSRVKEKLSDIGRNTRRSAPIIKAIKAVMKKTDDPFTQIAEKKSYAPEEENDIAAQIEGVAGAAQDAVSEGVSQVEEVVRSTGQRASQRRAQQAEQRARQRAADRADLNRRFATVGQKLSDVDNRMSVQQQTVSNMNRTLGTTYGGVIGLRESLAAIKARQAARPMANLPSNYKATEAEAFRAAEAFQEAKGIAARNPNVRVGVDSKGRPVATAVQRTRAEAGPLARTAQGNAARVRANAQARAQTAAVNRKLQGKTVSQVKSENKKKMQDAAKKRHTAFKKSQAQKKKSSGKGFGGSATQGKNAPSRPKAGSFGISAAGKRRAAANRAAAAKKKSKAKSKSKSKSTSGSKKGSRGGTGSKGSRGKGGAGGKGGSTGGSKRGSRGARGSAGSRGRGGTSRGGRRGSRGRGGRRGGRRCDIRCKVNISLLTNMNLFRDDLADVAYFVRELREVEL